MQHAPGDARELVSKGDRQDVVVQALGCRRDPGLEAMALPSGRPQQDDAGGLDEQGAQVLVASFGDLAEDGAIAGGDLLWYEAEPDAEVAPLGEDITGSDGGNRGAEDDGTDARYRHQALTGRVLLSKQLDLAGDSVDALIETLPVADEVLEDVEQARSEHVGARGEDAGSASRSRCKP